jgi:hypothetical protein
MGDKDGQTWLWVMGLASAIRDMVFICFWLMALLRTTYILAPQTFVYFSSFQFLWDFAIFLALLMYYMCMYGNKFKHFWDFAEHFGTNAFVTVWGWVGIMFYFFTYKSIITGNPDPATEPAEFSIVSSLNTIHLIVSIWNIVRFYCLSKRMSKHKGTPGSTAKNQNKSSSRRP